MTKGFDFTRFNFHSALNLSDDRFPGDEESKIVHDDGSMAVHHEGDCFVFFIGQDVKRSEYNRRANEILFQLGIEGRVAGANN